MNRIRLTRLLVAGLVTLLAFMVIELIWEGLIGTMVFGKFFEPLRTIEGVSNWSLQHQVLNLAIALTNCLVMIWLYASLRPMFGVGSRTALIASAFVLTFVLAFELNHANLGFFPYQIVLIAAIDLIIELPLALIFGAWVYESGKWESQNPLRGDV